VVGRAGVADDQARPVDGGAGSPEAGQALQGQAVLGGAVDELALSLRAGQVQDRVQAGRDPGDVPSLAAQRGRQAVAAAPVGQAGAADLPVVAAGGDEFSQDQLVQARRARGELRGHRVQEPRRDDQPAEA